MYILSQILVLFADLLYIASMLSKKKLNLVLLLFISDILFASHYFCLGSLTGSTIIFIDSLFLLATYFIEKNNHKEYIPAVVIVTIIATISACIFTWNGLISLLPLFSMLIYLIGMIFSNVIFVKFGAMIRNMFNIIYMLLLTSYLGAGLEFILMLSAIIGIILNKKSTKKED